MIPDWQLPVGVDRGLWDYFQSSDYAAAYDGQMAESPLAARDVAFCREQLSPPGRLLDLGCGTGRLCIALAASGYDCVGVDLSPMMLAQAEANRKQAGVSVEFRPMNIVDLAELPDASFDYAASLFSTLGMIRGEENRRRALQSVRRILKPHGKLVLHTHNRWFCRLGTKTLLRQLYLTLLGSSRAGDLSMVQSYGGAPLTLHHFLKREERAMLTEAGFRITGVESLDERGEVTNSLLRTYGRLTVAEAEPADTSKSSRR